MTSYLRKIAITVPALLLAASQPVYPVASVRLSDGVSTVTVADGGVGDLNPLAGVVTFSGVVGLWIANVTTGISDPILGSPTAPHMDLNSVNVLSVGPGVLTVMFSDDFFGPTAGTVQASIGGTTMGSVTYKTYADSANGLFALTTLLTSQGPFSAGAFSGTDTDPLSLPADYSLTQVIELSHTGNFLVSSFNAEVEVKAVPDAGGTLVLLGSTLMALGFFGRSRKSVTQA